MNSYCVLKYQSKETINLERGRYKTLGKEIKLLYKMGFSAVMDDFYHLLSFGKAVLSQS